MAGSQILERPKEIKNTYKYIRLNKYKTIRNCRMIMEKYIGRKLLNNECIHHINGDKSDDRIENLIIMDKKDHVKLHHLGISKGKMAEDHKQKISKVLKGKPKTDEHIQKVANANKGKKVSLETRIKISESLKGIKHSEERKKKTSEAIKKWWRERKGGVISRDHKSQQRPQK